MRFLFGAALIVVACLAWFMTRPSAIASFMVFSLPRSDGFVKH